MKEFILGLAAGMAGGAILVANSCKLRKMIKKNQDELMQKAECYIDEQLEKNSAQSAVKGSQQDTAKKSEKN